MDRFAEHGQRKQHGEIACELERQGCRDGCVDDELVAEGDLANEPGIAADAGRTPLESFLRGEPGPQGYRDEGQEALAVHGTRLEDGGEDVVINREQGQGMTEGPGEAADAAEIPRKELATEKIRE